MEQILLGSTDRSILVFIPDAASTDGSGKTGLVAADLTVSYARVETDNDVTVTDVTSSLNNLSALTDAHNDWGLKEVSNTLAPGLYRLDIADAVFASGAWYGIVYVMVTTSAASASPKAFHLVAYNALDSVRLGLTALPNASADGAGGLPISDAGGLDMDLIKADTAAILVDTAEIGTAGAGLTAINLPNQTMDIVGNITGNLSGSVGSVTAGVTLTAPAIQAIWDALTAALTTVGSIGKLLVDNLDTTVSSRASQTSVTTIDDFLDTEITDIKAKTDLIPADPADASDIAASFSTVNSTLATIAGYIDTEVAAIKAKTDNLPTDPADASDIAASFTSIAATLTTIAAYIDTEVAAIKAKTDNLPTAPAATGDAMTLTSGERTSVADALLTRNMVSVTGEADRSPLNALRALRNKVVVTGTAVTVYEEDDSTTAWTAVVTTNASADPITAMDPA